MNLLMLLRAIHNNFKIKITTYIKGNLIYEGTTKELTVIDIIDYGGKLVHSINLLDETLIIEISD